MYVTNYTNEDTIKKFTKISVVNRMKKNFQNTTVGISLMKTNQSNGIVKKSKNA